jgi:hypothetical protein
LSRSGEEQRLAALKESIQPVKEFVEIQVNHYYITRGVDHRENELKCYIRQLS